MRARTQFMTVCLIALALAACDRHDTGTPTSTAVLEGDAADAQKPGATIQFSDAQIYFEYNSTADDAGIQVFLDAEDWKEVSIHRGNTELLEIETGGGMRELGLTELRFEGAEPSPQETLDAFPAGVYKFRGVTVDGHRLSASAQLSQDLPAAPVMSPSHGETVNPDNVEITWDDIAGIDRYQVIVETDANDLSLEVSVSADTHSLHVPPTYLVPNTEYKLEVIAIAPSGNRTISEGTFFTGP